MSTLRCGLTPWPSVWKPPMKPYSISFLGLLMVAGCEASPSTLAPTSRIDGLFVAAKIIPDVVIEPGPGQYIDGYVGDFASYNALRMKIRMSNMKYDQKWAPLCQIFLGDGNGIIETNWDRKTENHI